jgi:hypothetical protein
MKRKRMIQAIKQEKVDVPGYPLYPDSEDIYKKSEKMGVINPTDILIPLTENDRLEHIEEGVESPQHDALGYPLDISGSELDDKQEAIGNEDEENNYYSIGGENHDNLRENRGE